MSRSSRSVAILRETCSRFERRAPLTPSHVSRLIREHGVEVLVQPSAQRVFADAEYVAAGASVREDVSAATALLGVKAVPLALVEALPRGKTIGCFSHTIKGQEDSMALLDACVRASVRLVDYECIRETGCNSPRLVAFGEFAGKAGAINALRGLGLRLAALGQPTPLLGLRGAYEYRSYADACVSLAEVGAAVAAGGMPRAAGPLVIAVYGGGNVGRGALDALAHLGDNVHVRVQPSELAALSAAEADSRRVYVCALTAGDVVEPLHAGAHFSREEYYAHPERYRPVLHERVLPHVDCLVNGAYWDARYPRLLTARHLADAARSAAASGALIAPRLQMVADLSCDVHGALEPLVRTTTIDDPFFLFDFATGAERAPATGGERLGGAGAVAVLGTDILPAELPREASEHFGEALFRFVPALADPQVASRALFDQLDTSAVGGPEGLPRELWSAVIACDGRLAPRYESITKIRVARAREESQRPPTALAAVGTRMRLLLSGHLFDSGLINTALDLVEEARVPFRLEYVSVGGNFGGCSSAVIALALPDADAEVANALLAQLEALAAARPAASASIVVLPADDVPSVPPAAAAPARKIAPRVPAPTSAPTRRQVAVLGAGMCAAPAVELLTRDGETTVRVVSAEPGAAALLCAQLGRRNAVPVEAHVDERLLGTLLGGAVGAADARCDAILSLLPAPLHARVARACIGAGVPLVTASYAGEEMRALGAAAAAAGVPVLCEMGLDPGIDHMSAMALVAGVKARGGIVRALRSVCGGLPSAEVAVHTPLRYKFSWSPAGVFSAVEQSAAFWRDGARVDVAGGAALLGAAQPHTRGPLSACYQLEVIPNRDSLAYAPLFGLELGDGESATRELFRGTLRYAGWAAQMAALRAAGLMDAETRVPQGVCSWAELASALGLDAAAACTGSLIDALGARSSAEAIAPAAAGGQPTVRDAFCALLARRLAYRADERDLVLMEHELVAEFPDGTRERIVSSLALAGGGRARPTAMAQTVGLTAAMGVRLMLSAEGRGALGGGVHVPTHPAVYTAVLPALESEGISFAETCEAI